MWEGVASLGLSLPLSPPPASYLQWGWAGSSLEFRSPFVLRTAGSVFPPVNFSLLSHSLKQLPLIALRALRPVLTLSNAARSSPFCPHLLVPDAGHLFPPRPQRAPLASVQRSWPLAATLPAADVDHPESQEFFR